MLGSVVQVLVFVRCAGVVVRPHKSDTTFWRREAKGYGRNIVKERCPLCKGVTIKVDDQIVKEGFAGLLALIVGQGGAFLVVSFDDSYDV